MGWVEDFWRDLTEVGSGTWLALAVWAVALVALLALIYAHRQLRRNRVLRLEEVRPHVAMFMEPHEADWHLVELVVRNYGQTAAYDIGFSFANPPTVAFYENAHDGMVDIGELRLPGELPVLAPRQEWRTVWDSALDRRELEGSIESRFEGSVTYYDSPAPQGRWLMFKERRRRQFQAKVVLDWEDLQPVQRIELMTGHDLAKREKQKLELLRSLLTYFHHAGKETRPDVLRSEIDRINRATEETKNRLRAKGLEMDAPTDVRMRRIEPDGRPDSDGAAPQSAVDAEAEAGRHRGQRVRHENSIQGEPQA